MASQATPKRLYFDTNILWRWPQSSNEIWNLFSFAKWLKIELYIPKVVEDELETQFVVELDGSAHDGQKGYDAGRDAWLRKVFHNPHKGGFVTQYEWPLLN